MTVQIDLFTLIIMVVIIILAAFLLPMIWQFKKTAEQAEGLLSELRRELVPTMRELRETGERINGISKKIAKGTEKAENMFESIDEVIESIDHLGKFIQQDLFRYVRYAECFLTGIRAAGKVFIKEARNKEVEP